jgi:Lipopolysaccharide-assembly
MLRRAARLAPLAAIAAWATLACSGYRVVHASEGLGSVKRVAVETLVNDSYEPGLELMVTEALRREMQRRGGVELVKDAGSADLVLSGAVVQVVTAARSFSSIAFALEYQVDMTLALQARRPDGTLIPVDPAALRDWELYLTSSDVEVERRNREEALRRLASVLAERVHDSLADRLLQ